ncbi:MAG: flagellar hook basal-body protein [Myxococcota bacterium]
MSTGIYAALSGAIGQQVALEHTATNLANLETSGYRAVRPVFQETLQTQATPGEPARYAAVTQTAVDTRPGVVEVTERPLDIALPADAFLGVETPAGERFTRAGSLVVSPDGQLTTRAGLPVLSETQEPITVDPQTRVTITPEGEVQSDGQAQGFLRVVRFADPSAMAREGGNLYRPEAAAGAPEPGPANLQVGVLERSNASPIQAVSDMMMAQRTYDAMQKAIRTFKDIDKRLVTTVPKA